MEKDIAIEQERNARYRPPKILEPIAFQEPPPKVSQAPASLGPVWPTAGLTVRPLPCSTDRVCPYSSPSPSTQPSVSTELGPCPLGALVDGIGDSQTEPASGAAGAGSHPGNTLLEKLKHFLSGVF